MKKSRWKQGFARLLIICLLMNQTFPVSAQTLAEQEVTPLVEMADSTETSVDDVVEAVEDESVPAVQAEAVVEESVQTTQEEAEGEESAVVTEEGVLTRETALTSGEETTVEEPDVVGSAEGLEGNLGEGTRQQMPEWMANARDLVFGENVSLAQGDNYFRLTISEPGMYHVKDSQNISLDMYDEETQYWYGYTLLALQEVGEYYLKVISYGENNTLLLEEIDAVEMSLSTVYEKEVPSNTWYTFTPEETGKYLIHLSDSSEWQMSVYMDLYDKNGQSISSDYCYGGDYNWRVELENTEPYYVRVRTSGASEGAVYTISVEKEPKLERVEVLQYPTWDTFYEEVLDFGQSMSFLEGMLLKLYFDNGTTSQCTNSGNEYHYLFDTESDVQRDEEGQMKPGVYTFIVTNDLLGEVMSHQITYRSIVDETKLLKLNQEEEQTKGWIGYKLSVENAGYYEIKGLRGTIYLYDNGGNLIDSIDSYFAGREVISLKEAGDYYLLINCFAEENEKFIIKEISYRELFLGAAETFEITATGEYYAFTPEKSGIHKITIVHEESLDNHSACVVKMYDAARNEYINQTVGGSRYQFSKELEAGKTYYITVTFAEGITGNYEMVIDKQAEPVSIELVQAPYRSQQYYGFENGSYYDLQGFKFGITFDDGSYREFEGPAEEWNGTNWSWNVYKDTGELASYDNRGYYPIGNYQVIFTVYSKEVKGVIPFSVVSLSDIKDKVLKVDQPVEGLLGKTNQAVYSYLAVEIPEAGQYRITSSVNGYMYLYSGDGSYLTDTWNNQLLYKFEQPGTYYLRIGAYAEQYSVSMEKIKEITSIDVSFQGKEAVYYYGINEYVEPYYDIQTVLTFEDKSTAGALFNNEDWHKYELVAQVKDATTHEVVRRDSKQCYPVGKYYVEVSNNIFNIAGRASFEVKPLEDYEIELTLDKDVALKGMEGQNTKGDIKVVFPKAGTYVISNNGNASCTLYDSAHNRISMGMANSLTYEIRESGVYYLRVYHLKGEITFTMDKYYAPVQLEVTKYTKELFTIDGHNQCRNLFPEFEVTLEDDSTKTFEMYDGVWYEYGFIMQLLQRIEGEWQEVSHIMYPQGEYRLIVTSWKYDGVKCEIPFTVNSPDKAKAIELDKEVTSDVRNQIYQINIPEDGAYEIRVTGKAQGYFGFSNDAGVSEAGKGNYGGQKPGMILKAGKKYLRVYNNGSTKEITFTISKMPDITSVSHNKEEKLEVIYGTWGYRISNGISGNMVISVSGNRIPTVPGAKIEGMSSSYKDASGNNIVSGNGAFQETFTFPVTLDVKFEGGTEEEIFFNSTLWDIYGFVEKVFQKDGSPIYADEKGYAAIGEYMVEFEAQGKSVKLPFSVVESETVKDIRKASVSFAEQVYEGKPVEPVPKILYGDKELIPDKDYTLRYRDNYQVGTGQAMIIGRGGYSGTLIVKFNIVEKEQKRADVAEEIPQNVMTPTVKEKTGCETVEELENYLEETITSNEAATEILPDVKKEDIKVVDITLEMSSDGGKTWEKVTPENFPEEGMDVIIPYPEGMDMFSHDYIIAHLITTGEDAGKVEYPKVTKEKDGMRIHINSTSPFAIGWKTVPNPFGDVSESSWAYKFAKFALDYKLMSGKGKDTEGKILFDPTKNMTRAEFVQTLYNKEGKPAVEYVDKFEDVPDNQWYTDAIIWAAENDIVAGKGKKFDVSGEITRQEMATILCKYATNYKKYETEGREDYSKFEDSGKVEKWAKTYMEWALHYGIMKGRSDNTLGPLDNATRAEGATMLKNFISKYE